MSNPCCNRINQEPNESCHGCEVNDYCEDYELKYKKNEN